MSAPTPASATALVRTSGLRRTYGDQVALDHVDLEVGEGGVYGLVGPNGAGKTTLLSILAGLRRPTSGTIDLPLEPRQMAVVADTPRFEPWLTAREVVDLARHLTDPGLPESSVAQALGRTGLGDAADRRVGGFSRGMLQRLGLAAGIVGRPRLLMLDEPSSALDPAGRRDVLDLVSAIGAEATVLFSSHILSDVQQVSDTVGILRAGRLLYQGPLEQLLVGRAAPAFEVRLRSAAQPLVEPLLRSPWVTEVAVAGQQRLRVTVSSVEQAESGLVAVLAAAGARVISIAPQQGDLEHIFLELTS